MNKRILAIALCLVMVSAFAVTGAVSATGKPITKPIPTVRYPVYLWDTSYENWGPTDTVVGYISINLGSGAWSANCKGTANAPCGIGTGYLYTDDYGFSYWNLNSFWYNQASRAGTIHASGVLSTTRLPEVQNIVNGDYPWGFYLFEENYGPN